jgi:pyruvate/2-oxoglutarate dehydrogenase complex dihydrolipoamide acyltransferase (E2) component
MSVQVVLPHLGESVSEATIVSWRKSVGETVATGEALVDVATDKVDTEIPSPSAGVLGQVLFAEDDVVRIGQVIAVIDPIAVDEPAATPAREPSVTLSYSPLVSGLAAERGVDLASLVGSGIASRVRFADVQLAPQTLAPSARDPYVQQQLTLTPLPSLDWPVSRVPSSQTFAVAAERNFVVRTHLTEIDVSPLQGRLFSQSAESVSENDRLVSAATLIRLTTSTETALRFDVQSGDESPTLFIGGVSDRVVVVSVAGSLAVGIRKMASVSISAPSDALSDDDVDTYFRLFREAIGTVRG